MRSLMMFAILAGAPALAEESDDLKTAIDLPLRAKELRDSGLDADQVVAALDAAKEAKMGASEMAEMFAVAAPLVKEHGPVENFGELVKGRIEEGLRGEDLAAAIKDAHENKGKSGGGDAAGAKPEPAPTNKPTPKPTTKPGPMTRPGIKPAPVRPGGGGATRPGSGGGGGTRPAPRPSGGGGGMTRPGGAR